MSIATTLEEAVLAIVSRHTAADPIARQALVSALRARGWLTGISQPHADRQARDAIQKLRTEHPQGGRIVSSSGAGGYWWATSPEEIEACLAEDKSRVKALSTKIRNMERARERLLAQPLEQKALL